MKLKKINEFFDTEDLKNQYEIPYLKGEMGDEISKFKKIPFNQSGVETTESFFEKVILEYPILAKFQNKVINAGDDKMCKMIGMFATSYEPAVIQGHKLNFYAQLGIYFTDGFYGVHIILRDLNDLKQDNWEVKTYEVKDIKETYRIIDSFIIACGRLNIIKPEDKFSIRRN